MTLTECERHNKSQLSDRQFYSIEELINSELGKLSIADKYKELKKFISDDKECADLVNSLVEEIAISIPDNYKDSNWIAQKRAQHTIINYFLGTVFLTFAEQFLFKSQSASCYVDRQELLEDWLFTALYHDIGYFSNYLTKSDTDLDKISKYKLFTDDYDADLVCLQNYSKRFPTTLAYTYEEIIAYEEYSCNWREERESKERIDHGILGGVLAFDKLIRRARRKNNDLNHNDHINQIRRAKKVCLTIAQHNIFKSSSEDKDAELPDILKPKLSSVSPFRISEKTPLLLLLSLVDTIENVKKFSKSEDDKNYLQVLTVLKSTKVKITDTKIELDLSALKLEWGKKDFKNESTKKVFDKYVENVKSLQTWTTFSVSEHSDVENVLIISLNEEREGKNV